MRLFLLSSALILLLTSAAIAQEKEQGLFKKLGDSLASGEVVAVVLAGAGGWAVSLIGQSRAKHAAEAAELGRLKFKQENADVTRQAIREGMAEIKEQLSPAIANLSCEISSLRKWLASVDDKADRALNLASVTDRTQSQWIKQTEAQLGQILSSEHPTLIGNLFFEEKQNDNRD
jgi:hypothetical protein